MGDRGPPLGPPAGLGHIGSVALGFPGALGSGVLRAGLGHAGRRARRCAALHRPRCPLAARHSGRTAGLGQPPRPSADILVSLDHVLGTVAGGASLWLVRAGYYALRGREGLGLGDVKLAAAAGAWVGWQMLSLVLLMAATAALGLVLIAGLLRRAPLPRERQDPVRRLPAPSIWVVWVLDAFGRGA